MVKGMDLPEERKHSRDTSWNKVANWYDRYVSESSDHHNELILPGVIRMLAPQIGEKILDIGCGEGVMCREISRSGAHVTGVDASKRLIDLARQKSSGISNIKYHFGDAAHLKMIADGNFTGVICVLALANMEDLSAVITEVSRVTKTKGRFLIVMNHPCFRIPRQSGWGFDEKRKLQYRRVDRYMSPLKIPIQMHPGSSPDIHTWTFHRPLSEYFGALNKNGFAVSQLEEWVSLRKSKPGAKAKSENMSREEIPLFLAIEAVKL